MALNLNLKRGLRRSRRDELAWGVRTGGDPYAHTHGGKDQWAHFQADARQEHQFSRAMASIEHLGAFRIRREYVYCSIGIAWI